MIYQCDICNTELVSIHSGTITCYLCLRSEKGWRETIAEEILKMPDIDGEAANDNQVLIYRKDAALVAAKGLDVYGGIKPPTWTCKNCGNNYSTDISACPNENIEKLYRQF